MAEVILWKHIKRKSLGVEFHRQVPLLNYIVDFYCHKIGWLSKLMVKVMITNIPMTLKDKEDWNVKEFNLFGLLMLKLKMNFFVYC